MRDPPPLQKIDQGCLGDADVQLKQIEAGSLSPASAHTSFPSHLCLFSCQHGTVVSFASSCPPIPIPLPPAHLVLVLAYMAW